MLAGRMEYFFSRRPDKDRFAPDGVMRELRRLYYDTANTTAPASMAAVLRLLPISQIVFGSDYPYVATAPQLEELLSVGCSSEQLQAIKFDNAKALLNQKTIRADANFK